MEIYQFECLSDNYGYLLHDAEQGVTACVDTPDLSKIEQALTAKGWTLTHILNTHHHPDHVGANLALKEKYGCVVIGPSAEAERIPGIDIQVSEGDTVSIGNSRALVHDMPGHTLGHIVYRFAEDNVAFVGDVLFPLGCGRLFEGTASQAWRSLEKLRAWPDDTQLYCAHEYSLANAEFALTIEPANQRLQRRVEKFKQIRLSGGYTVPSLLSEELETNPFLRPESPQVRQTLLLKDANNVDVFACIRTLKDRF